MSWLSDKGDSPGWFYTSIGSYTCSYRLALPIEKGESVNFYEFEAVISSVEADIDSIPADISSVEADISSMLAEEF